jgi:hypothetical protein
MGRGAPGFLSPIGDVHVKLASLNPETSPYSLVLARTLLLRPGSRWLENPEQFPRLLQVMAQVQPFPRRLREGKRASSEERKSGVDLSQELEP